MKPRIIGAPTVNLIDLSGVSPKELRWFWYPYIPHGNTTQLFGAGGIGKSTITQDLAARVTNGDEMPSVDHRNRPPVPGRVLIYAAEDDPEYVLVPKLIAAGADLSKVRVPAEVFTLDAKGLLELERHILAWDPELVIIDPVVAYMGGKLDMNKMNEVRTFTGALASLAMEYGVAIILVHHKKKGEFEKASDKAEMASGSQDFTNGVRSSIAVYKNEAGKPVMELVKANYAPTGDKMHYMTQPGFHWLDGAGAGGRPAEAKANAGDFLRSALKFGPQPAKVLERDALAAGISKRTLDRAKVGIAESFLRIDADGTKSWYWRLVGWKPADAPQPEPAKENPPVEHKADLPSVDRGQLASTTAIPLGPDAGSPADDGSVTGFASTVGALAARGSSGQGTAGLDPDAGATRPVNREALAAALARIAAQQPAKDA